MEEFSKSTIFVTRNFRVMYYGHTKLRKLHIFTFSLLYQIYRSACKVVVRFYVYLSAVAVLRRSLGETVHTRSREIENLLYCTRYTGTPRNFSEKSCFRVTMRVRPQTGPSYIRNSIVLILIQYNSSEQGRRKDAEAHGSA
jgi:hypothetical protein